MIKLIKDVNYTVLENNKIIFTDLPDIFEAYVDLEFVKHALNSSSGNRKIIRSQVEDLKQSIREKKWVVGDSCALFEFFEKDQGYSLRNAHHRLISICEEGQNNPDICLPLAIRTTHNHLEIEYVDTGRVRNLQDHGKFTNNEISAREQQVLNAFVGGGYISRQKGFDIRNSSMIQFWNKYKNTIKETIEFLNKEGADAKVTAAFARALYNGVDINVLKRYAYYINNQMWPKDENGKYPNYDGDESIVALKNWLIKGKKGKSNYAITEEIFYKTQAALYKAINKIDKNSRIPKKKVNFFPIEEQKIYKKYKNNNILNYFDSLCKNWKNNQIIKPKDLANQIKNTFNDDYVNKNNIKKIARDIASLLKESPVLSLDDGKISPLNPNVIRQFRYKYIKNNQIDLNQVNLIEELYELNN